MCSNPLLYYKQFTADPCHPCLEPGARITFLILQLTWALTLKSGGQYILIDH
jgi:hypothetical protein